MAAEKTAPKPAATNACACRLNNCGRVVTGTFAQGHDARLVSAATKFVVLGDYELVPDSHWLTNVASVDDADARIKLAKMEFVTRFSQALGDKFDNAARNLWASASKPKRTPAATRKESKAARGAKRAEELMAKLEAAGKKVEFTETTPVVHDTGIPEAPKFCGTCDAPAGKPCTRKDGRKMPNGRQHEDHA